MNDFRKNEIQTKIEPILYGQKKRIFKNFCHFILVFLERKEIIIHIYLYFTFKHQL